MNLGLQLLQRGRWDSRPQCGARGVPSVAGRDGSGGWSTGKHRVGWCYGGCDAIAVFKGR